MNIDIDIDTFRYQWCYQQSVGYLCTSFLDAIIPYKRKRLQEKEKGFVHLSKFEVEKEFVKLSKFEVEKGFLVCFGGFSSHR